jgi:hypothetical protein
MPISISTTLVSSRDESYGRTSPKRLRIEIGTVRIKLCVSSNVRRTSREEGYMDDRIWWVIFAICLLITIIFTALMVMDLAGRN